MSQSTDDYYHSFVIPASQVYCFLCILCA